MVPVSPSAAWAVGPTGFDRELSQDFDPQVVIEISYRSPKSQQCPGDAVYRPTDNRAKNIDRKEIVCHYDC